MSYDFAIVEHDKRACPFCGHEEDRYYLDLGSPTYNVGPLFRRMGKDQDFQSAINWSLERSRMFFANCIASYREALESEEFMAELEAMQPENGWGSITTVVTSARRVLEEVHSILKEGGAYMDERYIPAEQLYFTA